jgi:hypothetical protein
MAKETLKLGRRFSPGQPSGIGMSLEEAENLVQALNAGLPVDPARLALLVHLAIVDPDVDAIAAMLSVPESQYLSAR